MQERRSDTRLLCADLVEVVWRDGNTGQENRRVGNLEDISLSGVCLQLEKELPLGTAIRMLYRGGEMAGVVRYAVLRNQAYFVGVELSEETKWSSEQFTPQHLLDPRDLLFNVLERYDQATGSPVVH